MGFILALLVPRSGFGETPEIKKAMNDMEELALKNPRPGFALWNARAIAAEARESDKWLASLEARTTDANALVIRGWMAAESGQPEQARQRFEQAVSLAPDNSAALLALAESQLRAELPEGEATAKRASDLFKEAHAKAGALLLPARISQEKGNLAGAWAALSKLESADLEDDVRLALIPDFARAHLAIGDSQKWAGSISKKPGAESAAQYAAACIALGDPALGFKVAVDALKIHDLAGNLQKVAIQAARKAGFGGEAAARIEASLGESPSGDELVEALEIFAAFGAHEHALRVFTKHAATLGPIAARWRPLLPSFWERGATSKIREILKPFASSSGWELVFALGEIAILENDYSGAPEFLWRIFGREFDEQNFASTVRAKSNATSAFDGVIPMPGIGIEHRLGGLQIQLEREPKVFAPDDETSSRWSVASLTDARDIAGVYLRKIATRNGGDPSQFVETLRSRTAHWIPEERLLTMCVAGNLPGILEAANSIMDDLKRSLVGEVMVRKQLERILALPYISPELVAHALSVRAKLPEEDLFPVRPGVARRSWHARLGECWRLFDEGQFERADKEFLNVLKAFGNEGLGPRPDQWASFHTATFGSAGAFDDLAKREDAAALALRWMGLQTPRRTDWPSAFDASGTWSGGKVPRLFWPMFQNQSQNGNFVHGGLAGNLKSLGGDIPSDLLAPLFYFSVRVRNAEEKQLEQRIVARVKNLPPECARIAWMGKWISDISIRGNGDSPKALNDLASAADIDSASVVRVWAGLLADANGGDGNARFDAFKFPTGPVGRGGWLLAELNLRARHLAPKQAIEAADALVQLPLDAESYANAKSVLKQLALGSGELDRPTLVALAGKLTLARLKSSDSPPLQDDIPDYLDSLIDAADSEGAVSLARRVLEWPDSSFLRHEKSNASVQRAVSALQTCGELSSWFDKQRRAIKPDDAEGWNRITVLADAIVRLVPGAGDESRTKPSGTATDSLDASLRQNALTVLAEASNALLRLEPEKTRHWTAILSTLDNSADGKQPRFEIDALLKGAQGGLDLHTASRLVGKDPERRAMLLDKWPIKRGSLAHSSSVSLGTELWFAGKRDESLAWLQKLFGERGVSSYEEQNLFATLVEMLAVRKDRDAIKALCATILRYSFEPCGDTVSFDREFERAHSALPLIEQLSALGMDSDVRATFEGEATWLAKDIAMLIRAHSRDAAVIADLNLRIAQPMMPQMLEDFAEILAGWPEAREAARVALTNLESAHKKQTFGPRILQLSRHGMLGARCGLDKAERWLFETLAASESVAAERIPVLLNLIEGMQKSPGIGNPGNPAMDLASYVNSRDFSPNPVSARVRELAAAGNEQAVRLLARVFTINGPPRDRSLLDALRESSLVIAAQSGKSSDLAPIAWVTGTEPNGTSEVAWSHGWYFTSEEKATAMRVASRVKPQEMKVELFYGEGSGRFERFAVIENAAATGVWRGRLPKPIGGLLAVSTAEGRVVSGQANEFRLGKNILPPVNEILQKLPPVIWKIGSGPSGDSLESVRLVERPNNDYLSFPESRIELPDAAGKNISVTGWQKRGTVSLSRQAEDGKWQLMATQAGAGLSDAWEYFQIAITAEVNSEAQTKAGAPAARVALILNPGGSYSGLQVFATRPRPKPREAPNAARNLPGIPGL